MRVRREGFLKPAVNRSGERPHESLPQGDKPAEFSNCFGYCAEHWQEESHEVPGSLVCGRAEVGSDVG
jgi:hypothetical protein